MKSICGANCDVCDYYKNNKCEGCRKTNGCPFGKKCWIAKYIEISDKNNFDLFKKQVMDEINLLKIDGMPELEDLYSLNGSFVNLEYTLPNGIKTKFLKDDEIYLGNQLQCIFNNDYIHKCFGIVLNMDFILICEYEENGMNPELLLFQKR